MSSFKRIPKTKIKRSDEIISVNDGYLLEEELFKKTNVQTFIDESKERIEQKEKETMNEIEQKKEQLYAEARKKGYEDGKQEAKETAVQEARERVEQDMKEAFEKINETYEKANQKYKQLEEDAEKLKAAFVEQKKLEIIDLAAEMAANILDETLKIEPDRMQLIFEKALNKIEKENKRLYVRVHPDTEEILLKRGTDYSRHRIEFLLDLRLKPGDIVIESDFEFLDARVEQQLNEMKDYVKGVLETQ